MIRMIVLSSVVFLAACILGCTKLKEGLGVAMFGPRRLLPTRMSIR